MARNTTLVDLLDQLRAEARLSLNPAHNPDVQSQQIRLLQKHQQRLWEDFRWPHLRVERQLQLQSGQRYYAPPSDIIIENIEKIEVFRDSSWLPLDPQIDPCFYSTWNSDLDERSWPPLRWDFHNGDEGDELEIWPIPDQNADVTTLDGVMLVTGIRNLKPLVDPNTDRADLDDLMLVAFAAAEILAGTGQKDAQLKLDFANDRYRTLRSRLTNKTTMKMFGEQPIGTRKIVIGRYRPPIVYST
jgi:hypothetical protein